MSTVRTLLSVLSIFVFVEVANVAAFSISQSKAIVSVAESKSNSLVEASIVGRKEFFRQAGGVIFGMATVASVVPTPAYADITNKVASSSALRNAKSAQKRLVALGDSVNLLQYDAFREALREAPLSEIRKACTVLVRGGEDGPNAEELQEKYKIFITNFEKADSTALVASRGRKIPEGEFQATYATTVSALSDFIIIAEKSAEIPVQYADSNN